MNFAEFARTKNAKDKQKRKPSLLANTAKGAGIGLVGGMATPEAIKYGLSPLMLRDEGIRNNIKNSLNKNGKFKTLNDINNGIKLMDNRALSLKLPLKRIGLGVGAVGGLGYGLYKRNKYNQQNKNKSILNRFNNK